MASFLTGFFEKTIYYQILIKNGFLADLFIVMVSHINDKNINCF